MKFVDAVDMGAPEYVVAGPAKVERISKGLVRVTYFTQRDGENIVPLHIVWDYDAYLASEALYDQAFAELRQQEWCKPADAKTRDMH